MICFWLQSPSLQHLPRSVFVKAIHRCLNQGGGGGGGQVQQLPGANPLVCSVSNFIQCDQHYLLIFVFNIDNYYFLKKY